VFVEDESGVPFEQPGEQIELSLRVLDFHPKVSPCIPDCLLRLAIHAKGPVEVPHDLCLLFSFGVRHFSFDSEAFQPALIG